MKQNRGAAIKLPKIPKKEHTRYAGMAYRPGGLSVPLKVVEEAVETVIRRRLEKEWGRPVRRSELRRDPSLPPLTEHPLLRKLARAKNRKTAPTVPKGKTGKRPGIASH
jgi:hypothetical protein